MLEDFITDARDWLEAERREAPGTASIYARFDQLTHEEEVGELGAFIVAAVEEHEEAREGHRIPAARVPPAKVGSRRAGAWWLGVAAAVLLLIGAAAALVSLAASSGTAQEASEASMQAREGVEFIETTSSSPPAAERQRGPENEAPQMAEVVEPQVERPTLVPEPSATKAPEPAAKPKRRRIPLAERLDRLDQEAQELWRAGELLEARSRFEAIVRLGGRRPQVQLAYGELFTLTRQLGGDEARLWQAYLERFPKGRYADDARAGLCGRAGSDHQACWLDYLKRHPQGTHAKRARDVVEASAGAESP